MTDVRFSGDTSGLSIGRASPEAAAGGVIGLVEDGDTIEIDIPNRSIRLAVDDETLAGRSAAQEAHGAAAFIPAGSDRTVSPALQLYASVVTSADRDLSQLQRQHHASKSARPSRSRP